MPRGHSTPAYRRARLSSIQTERLNEEDSQEGEAQDRARKTLSENRAITEAPVVQANPRRGSARRTIDAVVPSFAVIGSMRFESGKRDYNLHGGNIPSSSIIHIPGEKTRHRVAVSIQGYTGDLILIRLLSSSCRSYCIRPHLRSSQFEIARVQRKLIANGS